MAAEIKDLPHALDSFEKIKGQIEGKEVVVFLDCDGTLTPIVSHPEDALLSEEMRKNAYQPGRSMPRNGNKWKRS